MRAARREQRRALDRYAHMYESVRVSRIHFVGGEKGGVGKSVVSRLLCQWMLHGGVPFAALDADVSHGALLRAYGKYSQPVDLSVFESADQIMDRALGSERQVILDMPAKSHRLLSRWMDEGDVIGLSHEIRVGLTFWFVTDGSFQSVSTLKDILSQIDPSVQVVAVVNRRFVANTEELLSSWDIEESSGRGVQVIQLPALDPALMYKLDQRGGSFDPTEELGDALPRLSNMEQRRLIRWLEVAYGEMEELLQGCVTERREARPVENPDGSAVDVRESQPRSESRSLPVGARWNSGPQTWTEVGEGYRTHHVGSR